MKECTRCALEFGCGIENVSLNSYPPPFAFGIEKDIHSNERFLSSGLPIRFRGKILAAAPIVPCCVQYFSSSWHCHNGCVDGGLPILCSIISFIGFYLIKSRLRCKLSSQFHHQPINCILVLFGEEAILIKIPIVFKETFVMRVLE